MSTKLRAAVVGLGIGQAHVREYVERDDVDVVALVDPVPAALDAAAKIADAPRFAEMEAMLNEAEPDIVSLATPPHVHLDQTAACVSAGAHVLVEKPLAVTAHHCRQFVELAERTDRVVMVAQKKRFLDPVRTLKERLDGPWGAPRAISVRYWLGFVDKDWFWQDDEGGGPLVENAVHAVDLLRFFAGEVRSVYARGGNLFMAHRAPTPDLACVTLEFTRGAVASLAIGYGSEWGFNDEQWALATDAVAVTLSGPFDRPCDLRWCPRRQGSPAEHQHFDDVSGFREEIDAFIQAVRRNGPSPVPVADAARSIAVCLAIKQSLRTGQVVEP